MIFNLMKSNGRGGGVADIYVYAHIGVNKNYPVFVLFDGKWYFKWYLKLNEIYKMKFVIAE